MTKFSKTRDKTKDIKNMLITDIPRVYNNNVLVGRWLEDRTLQLAERERFEERRKAGTLEVQNTRRMHANLLKEVQLSTPDEAVRMGNLVQLIAPAIPAFCSFKQGQMGVVLAGSIPDNQVDYCQLLHDDCPVAGTLNKEPCVRNSWRISGPDGSRDYDGAPLQFGQMFTLVCPESATRCPLYLRASTNLLNVLGVAPTGPKVKLSTSLDSDCRWKVLHLNTNKRPETEGCAFLPGMPFVLKHARSNKALAVHANSWTRTLLGATCAVALRDFNDIYGQPLPPNIWSFGVHRLRDLLHDEELPCPSPSPTPTCPAEAPRILTGILSSEHARHLPSYRKSSCPMEMPCSADVKCPQLPKQVRWAMPPSYPCPRDPPCPRDCQCIPRPACNEPRKCIRFEDFENMHREKENRRKLYTNTSQCL